MATAEARASAVSQASSVAAAFGVAALSIAGFPLFNGFVSKGIVISASHYDFADGPLAFGGRTTLEWLLLAGGVGTFMSFITFGYYVFFHSDYEGLVADANVGQAVAMVAVAALCVFFGVVDSALFALLPYDVTTEPAVSHAYVTYTVDHIVEGVALAAIGLVGFALVKKPLSAVGRVPDVDDLYNPAVLYGSRLLVVGTTEAYAAADRVAVGLTRAVNGVVSDPRSALGELTGRESPRLTADIGASIVLVTLVLVATVAVLLM